MKIYQDIFEKIISPENLFLSWENFKHDKRKRKDVQEFESNLEKNIFGLAKELKNQKYKHGAYKPFYIQDPKQRLIHKAKVRDRVVHHAVFRILNPIFEPTFIPNSFSCQIGKGTHKGVKTLAGILRKVSKNNTKSCFALKCDIQKFFDSIDHKTLLRILGRKIKDDKAMRLLSQIIESYSFIGVPERERERERESKRSRHGIPIGNLTSQLFANVYLGELDRFVKEKLMIKHYLRYTNDFVIVSESSESKEYLEGLIEPISNFLKYKLKLTLHSKKIILKKYRQGIDFLGYIILPHYTLLRTKTKKRIFRKTEDKVRKFRDGEISMEKLKQTKDSYLGVLSHANTFKLRKKLSELIL